MYDFITLSNPFHVHSNTPLESLFFLIILTKFIHIKITLKGPKQNSIEMLNQLTILMHGLQSNKDQSTLSYSEAVGGEESVEKIEIIRKQAEI